LVAEILCDSWGPCEVRLVGKVGDEGIDLILVMGESQEYLVQVKHRENARRGEGPRVVRELCGVLLGKGKTKGVVVTSAPHFTKGAIDASEIKTRPLGDQVYEIELVDGKEFSAMLNNYPRDMADPHSFIDIYSAASALYG